MSILLDSHDVVFELHKSAFLVDPVIRFVKLAFNPIAESEIDFKRVICQHLVIVNSLE